MPKVKISEYSATANSNTDVASINIDEGCAPSGINNAIRAVMGHLKDFQQGTNGDPFNGPVNGTLGATTASTANVTTLTTSSTVTHNGGTANGVAYLNGSKVLTTGSALVFNGSNLGVGVTPSAWSTSFSQKALQFGPVGSLMSLQASSSNNQTYLSSNAVNLSGGWTYMNSDYATWYRQYAGTHAWFNSGSGTAGNLISETQAMTLDGSGNLGVGTTSPTFKLEVKQTGSTTAQFERTDGVYSISLKGTGTTATGALGMATNDMVLLTNGAERARLDSSGNLGVGTTSPTYIANYQNITINGTNGGILDLKYGNTLGGRVSGSSGGMTLETNSAIPIIFYTNNIERARIDSSGNFRVGVGTSTTNTYMDVNHATGSTNGASFFVARYNGTQIGDIAQATTSTVAYNTSSDYRLKENIQPMTGALEKVALLKPCTYTWKIDGAAGQGFIAHELQEVVPDCVTGEKDAMETFVDEEGNEQTRIKPQGIDTSFLVATLTAAIQEQQALITQLTARITALEGA